MATSATIQYQRWLSSWTTGMKAVLWNRTLNAWAIPGARFVTQPERLWIWCQGLGQVGVGIGAGVVPVSKKVSVRGAGPVAWGTRVTWGTGWRNSRGRGTGSKTEGGAGGHLLGLGAIISLWEENGREAQWRRTARTLSHVERVREERGKM